MEHRQEHIQIPEHYFPKVDYWMLGAIFALVCMSVLMVYSTTAITAGQSVGDSFAMLKKHFIHIVMGLVGFSACYNISPNVIRKYSVLLLVSCFFLLFLVLIPGIGHLVGGARRWLIMGPIRIQPGEIVKVLVVLYTQKPIKEAIYSLLTNC